MKIVVGINTLTSVDQLVYSNHTQFWFRLGRNYKNIDFALSNPRRMSIDNMRNMTAKVAVDYGADYLLFIDDDVLIPIDCLGRLLACDADIAAGYTLIRGYPFKNMFFKYTGDEQKTLENYQDYKLNDKGLIECDAVGFSCALIKVELLKKIKVPYFVTGPYNTEDIYFCLKAREAMPDCKIVVDPELITHHILGSELISPLNRDAYKRYWEDIYPESKDAVEAPIEARHEENPSELTYEDVLAHAVFGTVNDPYRHSNKITESLPE